MMHALLYHRETDELRLIAREELLESAPESAASTIAESDASNLHTGRPQCRAQEFIWVDVTDPDDEDFRLLAARFNLHPLIVEDIQCHEDRPKLHNYDDYLYIIFHAITI